MICTLLPTGSCREEIALDRTTKNVPIIIRTVTSTAIYSFKCHWRIPRSETSSSPRVSGALTRGSARLQTLDHESRTLMENNIFWEEEGHRAFVKDSTRLGRCLDYIWGPQSGGYIPQVPCLALPRPCGRVPGTFRGCTLPYTVWVGWRKGLGSVARLR